MAAAACATAAVTRCWSLRPSVGRRDVQGFLEERAVERVGLVEERQDVQRPVLQQTLERELAARDEAFHQQALVRVVPLRADLRQTEQRASRLNAATNWPDRPRA